MTVTRGELLYYLAAVALGSALGALRGFYLIRKHDLGEQLATVIAFPTYPTGDIA